MNTPAVMQPPAHVVGPPRGNRGGKRRRGGGSARRYGEAQAEAPHIDVISNGEAEAEAAVNDAIATSTASCTLLDGVAAQMAMLMAAIYNQRTKLYEIRMVLIGHNQNPTMMAQPWVYELRNRMVRTLVRQETLLGEVEVMCLNAKSKCETQGPVLRGPWLRDDP